MFEKGFRRGKKFDCVLSRHGAEPCHQLPLRGEPAEVANLGHQRLVQGGAGTLFVADPCRVSFTHRPAGSDQVRWVAPRYKKLASNHLATVKLVAIRVWPRACYSTAWSLKSEKAGTGLPHGAHKESAIKVQMTHLAACLSNEETTMTRGAV